MYFNVYVLPDLKCIASYNDFDYFVVDSNSKFIIKPTGYGDNIEYDYKNYCYQAEDFDGTKQKAAAIDPQKKELKTSKAQLRASKNYFQNHKIKEIRIRMSENEKKIITEKAQSKGLSVNAYLLQLALNDK